MRPSNRNPSNYAAAHHSSQCWLLRHVVGKPRITSSHRDDSDAPIFVENRSADRRNCRPRSRQLLGCRVDNHILTFRAHTGGPQRHSHTHEYDKAEADDGPAHVINHPDQPF